MNSSQVPHNNGNNDDGNNNNGNNDNGSSAKKLTAAVLKMKPKVRWLKSSFQAAN